MALIADRKGNVEKQDSFQDRLLSWMYGHLTGRLLLKPLTSAWFSKIGGRILDSRLSSLAVTPFIRTHQIDMAMFEKRTYSSYNAFFTRRILPGMRKIEKDPLALISPCDARLSVYPISKGGVVHVKHTPYTGSSLLKNPKLAQKYNGGWMWVFRLCVDDYHRYVYPDNGQKTENIRIPGVFHTVNPAANDVFPIYKENTREYTILHSEHFGDILIMEVGALLVGKIENLHGKATVKRGQEKGNFAFGGSTIILMTKQGKAVPDADIRSYSVQGIETRVLLGERVGYNPQ